MLLTGRQWLQPLVGALFGAGVTTSVDSRMAAYSQADRYLQPVSAVDIGDGYFNARGKTPPK